ncbi:liver merozoite formation protein, putative [Plasmodium reichenowi]|uniref:Liver merozoite formation protein, putative n=1 Tax=Plasmodium reichenowi TaxID=5854 RepID=A0A060RPR6_PLARE|nr:liver merozoite formation protein, putative [Plasmodium reichenowi]
MMIKNFYKFFILYSFFFFMTCLTKKMLFINFFNEINVNYNKKKDINKICMNRLTNTNKGYTTNKEYISNNAHKNICTINYGQTYSNILNDEEKEKILQQYIYTLSHLSIIDIDREKDISLNISLLLKACLASHNYIKNVEIYTSQIKNQDICSFIYENRTDFEDFVNTHILKYIEFFNKDKIEDTLQSYIKDKILYDNELNIFNIIKNNNIELRKDILQDISFECIRLNKIIQYSLAVNKLDLFSYHVIFKIFMYFKTDQFYYHLFLNNIQKIKYYYSIKNITDQHKEIIYKIVDKYLYIIHYMNNMYQNRDMKNV